MSAGSEWLAHHRLATGGSDVTWIRDGDDSDWQTFPVIGRPITAEDIDRLFGNPFEGDDDAAR